MVGRSYCIVAVTQSYKGNDIVDSTKHVSAVLLPSSVAILRKVSGLIYSVTENNNEL